VKPSSYNITLPDEPGPGEMIIFNTLSGSLFVLEPEYRRSLEALQSGGELSPGDQERLEEMAAEGYVVPDGADEDEMVVLRMRTAVYDSGADFTAKIMTTMACNLACEYCFESHMDRAQTMSLETAQAVVERIQELVEEISAHKVLLDFYGGEPLVNPGVIKAVSGAMGQWCQETGREYSFTMTTNGTLLTPGLVKELLPLGFKGARVSMDGTKEVQDVRRPFRSGQGSSHDVIVSNLREVADLVPVSITFLYSEKDPDQLGKFLDELEEEGLLQKLASLQPGMESGYLDQEGAVCNANECELSADKARIFVKMLKILSQRGVKIKQDLLAGSNCGLMANAGAWVFYPNGNIYKCPLVAGRDEYLAGKADQGLMLPFYYEGLNKELWRKCLEESGCQYLPMCGSGLGCRVAALAKTGDLWGMACSKEFFELYLPMAMRMEVENSEVE
jgi:uncharacterized protein